MNITINNEVYTNCCNLSLSHTLWLHHSLSKYISSTLFLLSLSAFLSLLLSSFSCIFSSGTPKRTVRAGLVLPPANFETYLAGLSSKWGRAISQEEGMSSLMYPQVNNTHFTLSLLFKYAVTIDIRSFFYTPTITSSLSTLISISISQFF